MTAAPEGQFRVKQDRMVRGYGQFLDDVKLPGMCHAAFIRSPHAHAEIRRVDTQEALRIPGAIAVLTPDDLLPHVNAVRPGEPSVNDYARGYDRYPLPKDKSHIQRRGGGGGRGGEPLYRGRYGRCCTG